MMLPESTDTLHNGDRFTVNNLSSPRLFWANENGHSNSNCI